MHEEKKKLVIDFNASICVLMLLGLCYTRMLEKKILYFIGRLSHEVSAFSRL